MDTLDGGGIRRVERAPRQHEFTRLIGKVIAQHGNQNTKPITSSDILQNFNGYIRYGPRYQTCELEPIEGLRFQYVCRLSEATRSVLHATLNVYELEEAGTDKERVSVRRSFNQLENGTIVCSTRTRFDPGSPPTPSEALTNFESARLLELVRNPELLNGI